MRARINAFHAKDAFLIVEFLPWKIKDLDLHWTFLFTVRTFLTLERVSAHSKQAETTEYSRQCSGGAEVSAPEPWYAICAYQNYCEKNEFDREPC